MRIATRSIFLALAALIVACAASSASHAAATRTSTQYRIEGRGWGHGIGMSQYGAEGYAARGWTGEQIIEHYFTGTTVAPRPANGPTSVRVLLQSYLAPARIQLTSAGTVTQGPASMELAAGDVVAMRAVGRRIVVTRSRAGAADAVLEGGGTADPVVTPQQDGGVKALFAADLAPAGTAWRGTLSGHLYEGAVSVVNTLDFESYIRGVVPHEVPASWHQGALEAQAITARSYALRGLRDGWFDLYSDTRSQAYGGMGAEEPSTDSAVAATAAQVARVGGPNGQVAQTFYFSTSAGRTAGNEEVWGSSPLSYLRSVESPYEQRSPYNFWSGADIKRYTPAQLGAALGIGGLTSASLTYHPSGYVKDLVARTGGGASTTVGASTVQSTLGLRSTYFRLQPLSITGPTQAAPGGLVTLTGMLPPSGRTSMVVTRGGVARTISLTANAGAGRWRVRARMGDTNVLFALTRSGIPGPRLLVRPVAATE